MSTEIVNKNDALSVTEICENVNHIQQVMHAVMKKGTHYDVVPGCGTKPTLLKPGAEKLAMMFRLDLQTETEIMECQGGHREYRSKTIVYHIKTGERLGSGMGSCSTLETKYKYRSENTGQQVPQDYWNNRDQNLLGGPSFFPRKSGEDGKWYIFQQVEHPNPADYYNTCLKMSEKRSKVAAILNVTAASDIFTQDIEDMDLDKATGEVKETKGKPDVQQPQPKTEQKAEIQKITTGIVKITQQKGKNKKGNDYTLYKITGEGDVVYQTFSDSLATLAKSGQAAGLKCEIEYTANEYGNTIKSINLIEPDFASEVKV